MKVYINTSAAIPAISPQEALNNSYFGPVYHGTSRNMNEILQQGFSLKHVVPTNFKRYALSDILDIGRSNGETGPSHGYSLQPYGHTNLPPPVHHLGFGIYFTTVKAIGKKFNNNSVKNLHEFYLDIDRSKLEEINFASPNRMMSWWQSNGYNVDPNVIENGDYREWIRATGNLTKTLRQKYDAVWFTGRSVRGKLLDGDQIVVFDPRRIYRADSSLASGLELGSTVYHTQNLEDVIRRYKFYRPDLNIQVMTYEEVINGYPETGSIYGKYVKSRPDWHILVEIKDRNDARILHEYPPVNVKGRITKIRENENNKQVPRYFEVKWSKGGTCFNYIESELSNS